MVIIGNWEEVRQHLILDDTEVTAHRAKIFGGWLVRYGQGGSITFVPDPKHKWN